MRRILAVLLAVLIMLSLVSCETDDDLSNTLVSVEPSAEPSHDAPDTPGLEKAIADMWAVDHPDEYGLDSYTMKRLEYGLIVAYSDTAPVDIDPPIGATDWLLRVNEATDSLYEVIGFARHYDEDGYKNHATAWRSGEDGAGVDIETAEALVAAMVARPELLPTSGDSYLDDEEHYPTALGTIDGDRVLVYATAHTDSGLGQDYGVFAVVPMALLDNDYAGNPYEIIGVDYGNGWQTLEG